VIVESRVEHNNSVGVKARINHHRLAQSALGTGDRADGLVVVSTGDCSVGRSDGWRVMRILLSSSRNQAGLAHGAGVAGDTCWAVFFPSLLLFPPPQTKENGADKREDTNDTTHYTTNDSAHVARSTAAGGCCLGRIKGGLPDDCPGDNGTTFSDDLIAGLNLGCRGGNGRGDDVGSR
jgi:hypothetical protein